MFEVGDLIQIVATEDDMLSKYIAGTYATIVSKSDIFETYTLKFIEPFVLNRGVEKVESYKRGYSFWKPKNLRLIQKNIIEEELDISESDIMSLIGGD